MSTKDSTAQHAQSNAGHVTPQEKIEGLLEIQKEIGHCMLTTRAPSGSLASRAMHPATTSGLGELLNSQGREGEKERDERSGEQDGSWRRAHMSVERPQFFELVLSSFKAHFLSYLHSDSLLLLHQHRIWEARWRRDWSKRQCILPQSKDHRLGFRQWKS